MKQTDRTLLEHMRITDFEIDHRKRLLFFELRDVNALLKAKSLIESRVDSIVNDFYAMQTEIAEISLLIGDADTLKRLRSAQRKYILDLFAGHYDMEYVNNRLRIGLVHKRIGVEPKLYLSAVRSMRELLLETITLGFHDDDHTRMEIITALDKLIFLM